MTIKLCTLKRLSILGFLAIGMVPISAGGAVALTAEEDAVTFLEEARDYVAKQEFSAAVIQLKNALRANPNNVDARFLLGEVYLRLGDAASAEKEFGAAIDRGMIGFEVKLRLGQTLLLQGKFEDLLSALPVDGFDDDSRPDAHVLVGRAHMGLKDFDDARASFDSAEALRPDGVEAKLGLARLHAESGEIDVAESFVDRALEINPQLPNAMLLKGEFSRLRRDLVGALGYFNSAVELQPRNIVGLLGRAATLIDLNRDDEAIGDIDTVFKFFPNHPMAMYFLALTQSKSGEFVTAGDTLAKTGTSLSNYMPSIYLNGVINYALKNFEQAQTSFNRFLAVVPGHRVARRLLGATQIRSGEHADALETLMPLVDAGGSDARLNALMGSAYMGLSDYTNATEYFEKAAAEEPGQGAIQTQLALSKLAGGDAEGAITGLESMIDEDPGAGQASVLLALVSLRNRDYDKAFAVATGLQDRFPENPVAANLIGAANLGRGQIDAARASFERALELKDDYFPALTNLAQIDIAENKFDQARARYQSILAQNGTYLSALYGLSNLALREDDRAGAKSWLEKAVTGNSDSPAPAMRLIDFYLSGGESAEALSTASQLALQFNDNADVLAALGRSQAASGDTTSAAATFRRMAVLVPNSPRAHSMVALALVSSQDPEGARTAFHSALALGPDFVLALQGLAGLEMREGNFDRALELAGTLRQTETGALTGDVLTGDIYMQMERPAEAIAAYEIAKGKQSSRALALRLYRAHLTLGETEPAVRQFQELVNSDPGSTANRQLLATGYLETEKYADAIVEYERLKKEDPDNAMMILNNLAWLYQQMDDPRAIETAEQAFALDPNSAPVIDTLGWITLNLGDNEKGLELLQKASALDPAEPEIRYHLVVALERSGRREDALRELNDLLSLGKEFKALDDAKALRARLAAQ